MGVLHGSQEYEAILKDSISHFITEFGRGKTDFLAERMILFRVVQNMEDPPLEFIWFYSALTFHSSRLALQETSHKVLILKDLFQSIVSCSEMYSGSQRVAVLAPALYMLCSCWKRDMCLRGEIEGLVEGIVSYISICCVDNLEGDDEEENLLGNNLMVNFVDLVRVWNVDKLGKSCVLGDALRLFFPLLSDEVRNQIDAGCGMRFLAGIVMAEFFLLRLCLKVSIKEKNGDLKMLLLHTFKGFQNSCFYDMLLKLMLEPSLPVTTLLSSGEEVLLRKVLYDAVLLGEFPFLRSGRSTQLNGDQLKNSYLVWLLVADNAIEFVREYEAGEHAAIYVEAFSRSDIPNLLIELITSQISIEEKLSMPDIPTPKALIKWLLDLEDQGFRIFEDCSTLRAKATICNSKQDYVLPIFRPAFAKSYPNTFINSVNKLNGAISVREDQEMVHSLHNPFQAAHCAMNLTAAQGRRKREEEMNEEARRTKIVKYNFHNHPVTDIPLPLATGDNLISGNQRNLAPNGLCTGIELGNTAPDDADEDMEDA